MTLHDVASEPATDDAVVDSAALFERRRWKRRLRAWRTRIVAALVIITAIFLVWVVFFSSWLGLRSIDVSGTHRVSQADVAAAAAIAPGTPLARVDLDAVEARVEEIPAVAAATVHRAWPHGITVTVTERQPVAAVRVQDHWALLDRTGVLFATVPTPDPARPTVQIGPRAPAGTLAQVASVLGALPADLVARTKQVTAASGDSITLHLTNGAEVRWGSASASAEKAVVLRALLAHKASFYDVTVPAAPATRG